MCVILGYVSIVIQSVFYGYLKSVRLAFPCFRFTVSAESLRGPVGVGPVCAGEEVSCQCLGFSYHGLDFDC